MFLGVDGARERGELLKRELNDVNEVKESARACSYCSVNRYSSFTFLVVTHCNVDFTNLTLETLFYQCISGHFRYYRLGV